MPAPSSSSPVDLQAIAAATGVSRMAVSLALRNQPGVSEETRRRIKAVAQELGYSPNPLVSVYQAHVRAGRSPRYQANLAWINDHPAADSWRTEPWLKGYLDGAIERAAHLGYRLEEFHFPNPSPNHRLQAARLRMLQHRGIFGVVLPWLHDASTARLDWSGFSVAMMGENIGYSGQQLMAVEQPIFHHVVPDSYYNLHLAWSRLREAGHRRIGLVVDHLNDALVESQQRARLHVLQESLPQDERVPSLVLAGANTEESRGIFIRWYDALRPTAVMMYNESLVLRLPAAARRKLTVAQLNHIPEHSPDDGVDNQHQVVAAAAVDLVVSQIQNNERGRPASARKVLVRGVWREAAPVPRPKPSRARAT